MWLKTFNLTTPIFVEVLNVMGSPCEFSPNLQKWVRASINLTKVLLDQFAIKLLNSRGVFRKMSIFFTVAPVKALAPCPGRRRVDLPRSSALQGPPSPLVDKEDTPPRRALLLSLPRHSLLSPNPNPKSSPRPPLTIVAAAGDSGRLSSS